MPDKIDSRRYDPFQIRFAPVCGIQMYEGMQLARKLPNYHLLLAHDVLAREDRYRAVFRPLRATDPHSTVILDNSVVELKSPMVDSYQISKAALAVKANVIILPDVYEDAEATIIQCQREYNYWEGVMDETLGSPNYSFMMVPQGKTVKEFAACASAFADQEKYPRIHWWGIPRNLAKWHGTRLTGLRICGTVAPHRDIHMLGFSDDFVDDFNTCNFGGFKIRGMDSAVPLRINNDFHLGCEVEPRPEGWLENGEYNEHVQANIDRAQNLLR